MRLEFSIRTKKVFIRIKLMKNSLVYCGGGGSGFFKFITQIDTSAAHARGVDIQLFPVLAQAQEWLYIANGG